MVAGDAWKGPQKGVVGRGTNGNCVGKADQFPYTGFWWVEAWLASVLLDDVPFATWPPSTSF